MMYTLVLELSKLVIVPLMEKQTKGDFKEIY